MTSSYALLFQARNNSIRDEFNLGNYNLTEALNLLVRRLSLKTKFKIEFLGTVLQP